MKSDLHNLKDRDCLWAKRFQVYPSGSAEKLDLSNLNSGPSHITVLEDYVRAAFTPREKGVLSTQQLRFALTERPTGNGMGMRIRLQGWESINYIAIGHTESGIYQHAKANHPLQDEWFDFDIGFGDISWGWRNNWDQPQEKPLDDVRLYIKGIPGPSASCDLQEIRVWQEATQPDAVFGKDHLIPETVLERLSNYQRAYFPNYAHLARSFLETGECPLAGDILLDWPVEDHLPPKLEENGTFQYSWHSQHPAVMLILLAWDENALGRERIGALAAARDLVTTWLDHSYDRPDPNIKYAWYDHGVAERLLAMIMLYAAGQENGFDARFMTRLSRVIHRHAQMLASEIFYAGHQPIRYHNHAWFQDLALMVTGLAFPNWSCADMWIETALFRITDQFSKLIIRDGDFAVFAENSIGYHFGITRIVQNIGDFAALSGRDTSIPDIAKAMARFSDLLRYPDGKRAPGQGDTFRLPNSSEGDPTGRKPYGHRRIEILPEAGYAIAKGDYANRPFMLCFFATSASTTHKHEDNLSFTLYMDGIEWLIDPSFYSHEYKEPLPKYLRSAAAHNAFVARGAPYSIYPGLSQLSGIHHDNGGYEIKGIHRAVEDCTFQRSIKASPDGLALNFTDSILPVDVPWEPCLMLHCGEGVKATIENKGLRLRHLASNISIKIDLPQDSNIHISDSSDYDCPKGISGLGFLKSSEITTIEICPPRSSEQLKWSLCAECESQE